MPLIYLAQSDTTAGLLSLEPQELNRAKSRPAQQPTLIESSSLSILKSLVRVPSRHKNRVRRASKSTFLYPNGRAVRVVKDELHKRFLSHFGALYSTSANPTGKGFDKQWAYEASDVIVCDRRGLSENLPSRFYRINHRTIKRRR